MKCQVTSSATSVVLISKEIVYKSYKDICSGEKKKANLGYNYHERLFEVENNLLIHIPRRYIHNIHGIASSMTYDWEILSKFFAIHNIEPNWLDCNDTYGFYDEDLGGWTGCMGKV